MAAPISSSLLPESATAADWYRRDLGTTLTGDAVFGSDPWVSAVAKRQCEAQFCREVPDLRIILQQAVNGNPRPLQSSVLRLIQLTSQLA